MSDALHGLTVADHPDLLVGFDTADDAAVFRVSPEIALVTTADYITPVVDDPTWFGRVAAANSLSDVWAMGGRPVTAINLVNFPTKVLDHGILREMLQAAAAKVDEAGAVISGGHSVDDPEPKFGLAVTGVVHPDRVLTNAGARAGDAVVLTKPLGSGVVFNANRAGKISASRLEEILAIVATLNGTALETAQPYEIHGLTDVTGFGLAGHALEMATASNVRIRMSFAALPLYEGALDMYASGVTTGSNVGNRNNCGDRVEVAAALNAFQQEILFDPQTSGGLLISVASERADDLVRDLHAAGVPWAAKIAEVEAGAPAIVVES